MLCTRFFWYRWQQLFPDEEVLKFCFRTGSFTSAPKALPASAADANDDDVHYPTGREDLNSFLQRCAQQLQTLPPPINRRWRKAPNYFCEKSEFLSKTKKISCKIFLPAFFFFVWFPGNSLKKVLNEGWETKNSLEWSLLKFFLRTW